MNIMRERIFCCCCGVRCKCDWRATSDCGRFLLILNSRHGHYIILYLLVGGIGHVNGDWWISHSLLLPCLTDLLYKRLLLWGKLPTSFCWNKLVIFHFHHHRRIISFAELKWLAHCLLCLSKDQLLKYYRRNLFTCYVPFMRILR